MRAASFLVLLVLGCATEAPSPPPLVPAPILPPVAPILPPVAPVPPPLPASPVVPRAPAPGLMDTPPLEELARISPPGASSAFGHALAFDGRRILAVDSGAEGGLGRILLFEREGDTFHEVARHIGEGAPDPFRAHAVALDGDTMIACDLGLFGSSSAYALRRVGERLVPGPALSLPQGTCSSLLAEEGRILASSPDVSGARGAVIELARDAESLRVVRTMEAPASVRAHDVFAGRALAMAAGHIVVGAQGAFGDGDVGGAVFIDPWDAAGSIVRFEGRELLFGSFVAFDGTHLATSFVGGRETSVAIYRRVDASWRRLATVSAPPSAPAFGDAIALAEGLLVVADPGRALLQVWSLADDDLTPRAEVALAPDHGVGRIAVAIADGLVVSGAPRHAVTDAGAILVFRAPQ